MVNETKWGKILRHKELLIIMSDEITKSEVDIMKKVLGIIAAVICLGINVFNYFSTHDVVDSMNRVNVSVDEKNCDAYGPVKNKTDEEIRKMFNGIKVSEEQNVDYDRDEWAGGVSKFYDKYRGKKVGIRDLKLSEVLKTDITSSNFSYKCPYTSEVITNYHKIDYDHVIPINYVCQHGGDKWSKEEKHDYYYDTDIAICSSASSNRQKSDKGPSEWLPETNQKLYCEYWIYVADKYNIPLSQSDYDVISEIVFD